MIRKFCNETLVFTRQPKTKAKNLLDRLTTHSEAVSRFIHNFQVPFDNNQAERNIRMMKLKQKISGSLRSESGAETLCRIRGYVSTLQKQGHHLFDALIQVFTGIPVTPILKS